ncbi:transmembrane amino acid transporter protein-domain-containing protein [Cyathus striatus]|nr:transmembrane amino acid transporter protein-domain-containing protein [Cyathus striatus]
MTSLSTSFTIGSASSASVRDAIASYRRAQYLVAGSTVASASETSDFEDDEESRIGDLGEEDEDEDSVINQHAIRSRDDSFIGQLDWDEEHDAPERTGTAIPPGRFPRRARDRLQPAASYGTSSSPILDVAPREDSPLLQRKISFTTPPHPRHSAGVSHNHKDDVPTPYLAVPPTLQRRPSALSTKSGRSVKYTYGGQSTFGQTLFNSIAILLGIGMLSEPLAFAYSGWVLGTILIMSYGFFSCYTAKILAKIILSDPRLRSYSDIGRKAFGPRSTLFISLMFCLELFAVSVILVTLYADSLHSIIPSYSADAYKMWGLIIFIPMVFLPLSWLSYTSILGIVSTVLLILVIFIDGISKKETPGSLWDPAPSNFGVQNLNNLGIAFGLFMASFSGHAVIPSLARDMIDPGEFDRMINWAFIVATSIYAIIGYAGYLMFGNNVSDEISVDLLNTKGYNALLNQIALWLLVLSPVSKFGLTTQPLNATIEILLGLDSPLSSPEDLAVKLNGLSLMAHARTFNYKRILAMLQRIVMTLLSVVVSICVPEFSSVMAFIGSFAAFMICIIGPILAKIALAGYCNIFDGCIIAVGTVMAVWGTVSAFLSA